MSRLNWACAAGLLLTLGCRGGEPGGAQGLPTAPEAPAEPAAPTTPAPPAGESPTPTDPVAPPTDTPTAPVDPPGDAPTGEAPDPPPDGPANAPVDPDAPPGDDKDPSADGADLVQAAVALADTASAPADVQPFDPPPPEDVPPGPLHEGTPEQLLALKAGNEGLARGDNDAALTGFIEAFDGPISGASISAGLAAAELHTSAGRTAEAGAIFDRLLQMAPDVPEIRFTAGRFFATNGQGKKAREQLEKAIALEPDFLPAYPMLGGVLTKTKRKKQAAELMLTYETRLKGLLDVLVDPQAGAHRKVPIIDLFALIDDDRVTRSLITAVGDASMHVRLAAADALTHDADPAALEAIAKAALAERDPIARRALAASLKSAKKRFDQRSAHPSPRMPAPGQ